MAFRRKSSLASASATPLAEAKVDPQRFAEVYVRYVDKLVVYFARRTMSTDLGVELAAETLASAFEQRQSFRGQSQSEEQGWIFAIASTQLHRYWRRGAVERRALQRLSIELPPLDAQSTADIERRAQLPELRRRLDAGLERLPVEQRDAIRLRVVEEKSYGFAARELGVSEQVVRARVSRGLRALAKDLDDLRTEATV